MLDFLKSITIEDIAITLAFVAGVIGSIAAIWKVYGSFREKRRERERAEMQAMVEQAIEKAVQPLKMQVSEMQAELQQNNVKTSRLDISHAIDTRPHEHQAILMLGEDYFLRQHGDAWMSGKFREWSQREGVDISYIAAQVPHLKG